MPLGTNLHTHLDLDHEWTVDTDTKSYTALAGNLFIVNRASLSRRRRRELLSKRRRCCCCWLLKLSPRGDGGGSLPISLADTPHEHPLRASAGWSIVGWFIIVQRTSTHYYNIRNDHSDRVNASKEKPRALVILKKQ